MIPFFPSQIDDLLDVESMPPTNKTELNYRTRPLTWSQEVRLTILVLFGVIPAMVLIAFPMHHLSQASAWWRVTITAFSWGLLLWLAVRKLTGAFVRRELILAFLFSVSSIGAAVWAAIEYGGDVSWKVSAVATWLLSCVIARQMAAWILVAPTVDHERMERWRVNIPQLLPHGLSIDCPELLTYSFSGLLVGTTCWLSYRLSTEVLDGLTFWPLAFIVVSQMVWLAWHVMTCPFQPWPRWLRSWQMTCRALVVFLTYDLHYTPAAGVFRFPTRAVRPPLVRWLLVLAVLTGATFSFGTSIQYGSSSGGVVETALINFLLMSMSGVILLACMLWLTAGTLLDRFDRELSCHKDDNTTDMDNYVDRIVNSNDELEREHVLLGVSKVADYPIMVHNEIMYQHEHIVGDSGASKTALGMAPQATQLIARGDCTVVIIDLKGDKAFFETCRREAARTRKLRFRWLSNEIGKTTFGFNPFLQSHHSRLSVEQLSQELLQGMALDYGIGYGAGYFTAMNEIVLSNVLGATGTNSFRELNEHLADRKWYSSIGHEDDWRQARHLGALVSRLAGSQLLNITPGASFDSDVHRQSIDVANLFAEPQVLYLSLRSAVEPTNAPAIARLFLWAMFNAASQHPQDGNRVFFFVDEMQQLIGDSITLIFEQFRDLGGTIIGAHQTVSQLKRNDTDLTDTVDSCTAMKQVFRASDIPSLERLEKLSGKRTQRVPTWHQSHERGAGDLVGRYDPLLATDGEVRISEQEQSRLSIDDLLKISSHRHSSLVRFTFGSGYTQFAGATIPMVSQFHITYDQYLKYRAMDWPTAPGAFTIEPPVRSEQTGEPSPQPVVADQLAAEEIEKTAKEFERKGVNRPLSV